MIGWYLEPDNVLASYRYRCKIPMIALRSLGQQCVIGPGDVTIFAKHWSKDDPSVAKMLRESGSHVIYDICDDHFRSEFDEHYRQMIWNSDALTCPTRRMAERIEEETGKKATVISDPYEYPFSRPKARGARNVLWFGHQSNLAALRNELPNLKDRNLLVVSGVPLEGVKFMQWSREKMLNAFQWADVVILPISEDDRKGVKSPNRMVESIRQGKYVVANHLDSYKDFGMWQGDIREGLEWVDKNREQALQAVVDAQALVEQRHAPRVIGAQWLDVINGVLERGDHDLRRTQDSRRRVA